MSPVSATLQAPEAQKAHIDSQTSHSLFLRNRGLTAKWSVEAGKLVCRWVTVQSHSGD